MGVTVAALPACENRSAIDVTGTPAEIDRGDNAFLGAYEADTPVFARIALFCRRTGRAKPFCSGCGGGAHQRSLRGRVIKF